MRLESDGQADPQPITDTVIQDSIVKAVQNVSKIMLRHEATLLESTAALDTSNCLSSLGAAPYVIGCVGFAGNANGLVYLCFTNEFAGYLSGHMLGMSATEMKTHSHDVVHDAIGEITNMTTGGFKNSLCDLGFPCKLSLPTIVRADRLSIAAITAASRGIFRFSLGHYQMMVDVQVKL